MLLEAGDDTPAAELGTLAEFLIVGPARIARRIYLRL
jgi:hypothetical protein